MDTRFASVINSVVDYVRGLIADANFACTRSQDFWAPRPFDLDKPTYLRRGLVIAGLDELRSSASCAGVTR